MSVYEQYLYGSERRIAKRLGLGDKFALIAKRPHAGLIHI